MSNPKDWAELAAERLKEIGLVQSGVGISKLDVADAIRTALAGAGYEVKRSDEEKAWLVEKCSRPLYVYVSGDGMLSWTDDVSRALRFARRADADAICLIVDDAERVIEHMWCAALAPQETRT